MPRTRLLCLALTLSLTSCQSWGDLLIFGPSFVTPATVPASDPAGGAGPIQPGSLQIQAVPHVTGTVSVNGVPLAEAAVTVVDALTGQSLADEVPTDDQGRFQADLSEPVKTGSVLLLTARKGSTELFATVLTSAPAADGRLADKGIDIATTLATKKLLPPLLEAAGSGAGTPGGASRLAALFASLAALEGRITLTLGEPAKDDRLRLAIAAATAAPTAANLEQLAIAIIVYGPLGGPFAGLVDAARMALIANIGEGGPVILPARWQVGPFVLEPPQVRRSGYTTVLIVIAGRRETVTTTPGAFAAGEKLAAVLTLLLGGLHNAPPPPASGGGGGGGTGGGGDGPGGGGASAILAGLPGTLLFISLRDTRPEDLFAFVPGGSSETQLTDAFRTDWYPAFSPDRSRIAFESLRSGNGDIYVINADGSGEVQLTSDDGWEGRPAWSPDGTKLAFAATRGGNTDIYVINADGTGEVRLTIDAGVDTAPQWSPDGTRIAFRSDRDGVGNLFLINADGSGEIKLTTSEVPVGEPLWSPDGTRILTTRQVMGSDIYLVNADGSGQGDLVLRAGNDEMPVWSPDGSRILFVSEKDGNREIYVINADGTGEQRLTDDPAEDVDPAWSIDGGLIVFASNRDGNYEIYAMAPDGSQQTRLTNHPGIDRWPRMY